MRSELRSSTADQSTNQSTDQQSTDQTVKTVSTGTETGNYAIRARDLTFQYPGADPVLKSVSLNIHAGQRVGIIGHNGCGKTTLFMLLCGVLTPTSGEIALLDKAVEPGQFRSDVGMLFQDPDDQLFSPSVREDIAFGPQNMGHTVEEVAKQVDRALQMTGMEPLAERAPHHLSGGEKQMVAIAGILAMQPKVVLYDEPTASLDLRTRRRLISFMQKSHETLLISSHDLEFILEVCDRILLIDNGQIIADGDPLDIMGDQALMEAHGLEKPHSLIPHVSPHHRRLFANNERTTRENIRDNQPLGDKKINPSPVKSVVNDVVHRNPSAAPANSTADDQA